PYYFCEYRFRSTHAHNPSGAFMMLATSACATIYTHNEYGRLRMARTSSGPAERVAADRGGQKPSVA
ncbi:hypothetical protein, partial [Cohnella hongkongensis]